MPNDSNVVVPSKPSVQGIASAIGFLAQAAATARVAFGWPIFRAISP
jgi:hypothetical protein